MGLYEYELGNKKIPRKDFLKKTIHNKEDREAFIDVFKIQMDNRISTLQSQWDSCIKQKNDPHVCQVVIQDSDHIFTELQENINILKEKRIPKNLI